MLRVALVRDFDEERLFGVRFYADRLERALAGQCTLVDVLPRPRRAFGSPLARSVQTLAVKEIIYPWQVRGIAADVAHVVDQSHAHLLRWIRGCATVVTCHDLWGLRFGSRLRRLGYGRRARGMLAASRVIAVSESTRSETIALGVPAERITVVRNRADEFFRGQPTGEELDAARARVGLGDEAWVLHVGNTLPYKNLEGLIRALGELRRATGRPLPLVKVGAAPTAVQRRLAAREGVGVKFLGNVSATALRALYHLALCLVYPSLHEGFGWPVAEALACGRPIVASRAGALPELVADAALLVERDDVAGFATAILHVLDDPELRRTLGERARTRADRLACGDPGAEVLEVYRQAIEEFRRR